MDNRTYKILVRTAIVLTLAWIAWTIYEMAIVESGPFAHEFAAASKHLEDGRYEDALQTYQGILRQQPDHPSALRGMAQALKQLGMRLQIQSLQATEEGDRARADTAASESLRYFQQSVDTYNRVIWEQEAASGGKTEIDRSVLGVSYANRGIVKDWMGNHKGALADYEKALQLEPEVSEGPGFLTRFLRNQSEKPPSVADRAGYLREQLAKPEAERLLRIPAADAAQRAYKM